MTTTIPWEDGSGDSILLTYNGTTGTQVLNVTSDPCVNPAGRSKVLTFQVVVGQTTITRELTVNQNGFDLIVVMDNEVVTSDDNVVGGDLSI